jgi:ribosomal protein S18 acetylase RimI-like enzyme
VTPAATGYTVRPASKDDLLGVVRVHERSPDLGHDRLSDRQRTTWDRMMATADLAVYVVEKEGEIVGTSCILIMPNLGYDCCPTAFIEAVVVAEHHRRRGVARMMVERMIEHARGASCRKVQLLSHKRHVADGAHDLYRSLEFEPEAEGFRLYLDVIWPTDR